MPELPEVEIVKRGLDSALRDRAVKDVIVHRRDLRFPIPEAFESVIDQAVIRNLERRGKYIVMSLDNAHAIVLHLGMSGRILIFGAGDSYTSQKHDHVEFHLNDGGRVVFNDPRRFGMLYLVDEKRWAQDKPFSVMGAEPLGNDFNAPRLRARLQGRKNSIKVALLDQRVVAGIGNIYACEALFDSGIDPQRLAGSLSDAEVERLCVAIRQVLECAIAAGGSTLKDYQHTDGSLGYFQHNFSVYDREGDECSKCGAGKFIHRVVQSGRSTFYCPTCQN